MSQANPQVQASSRPPRPAVSSIRFVDVRPGEGSLVWGSSGVLGGIVAGHVLLETARDALFLTKLPPSSLSLVYLGLAALGFLGARYDQWVSRALGRRSSLVLALMGAATGTMWFFLSDLGRAGTFGLYLWTGVVGTLLTVQFWLAAAQRFTPGQGRRLYGLIAAGGVVGAVLGGALGAALTQYVSVKSLLAAAAVLQLITAWFVTEAPRPSETPPAKRVVRVRAELRSMMQSPYLKRIGLLVWMSVGTLLVVDYLFKVTMAERFAERELGIYLARSYAVMNAIALVVQVFITMQVLRRVGTIVTLTLLPLCLVLSGGAAAFFGTSLVLVLVAKGADGEFRHSLHRVSTELLFLPLSPEERAEAKPFFDSVLTRVTQGFFAVALFVMATFNVATPRILASFVAGSALLWMGVAWSLRTPYLERFRSALGRNAGSRSFDFAELNLDSVEVLVEALSSPDEDRVIGAMSLFQQGGRSGLIPALVLYHPSSRVLVRALDVIPAPGRKDWVPLAERLMTHGDFDVRLAAIRALGSAGRIDLLRAAVFDEPRLSATAAFFVASEKPDPHEDPGIAPWMESSAAPAGQVALLDAIARYGNSGWAEVVLALHRLARGELDRALPTAMSRVRDPRLVPLLVQRLSHRDGRDLVRTSLVALGQRALDALTEALYDRNTPPNVRLHIPRAISKFGSERARDLLVDQLSANLPGTVRYKALRGLGRLVNENKLRVDAAKIVPLIEQNLLETIRMDLALRVLFPLDRPLPPSGLLLSGLLLDKRDQALERAMRLLQLLHPREDVRRVYFGLQSDEAASRIAAAEILEVLGLRYDDRLRELLRAVAEPRSEGVETERLALLLGLEEATEIGLLGTLLTDDDAVVASLAAAYGTDLDHQELREIVEQVTATNTWLVDNARGASLR